MAGFVELILLVHVDSRALKHSLWCLVLLFICLFNWPKVSVFQLKLASVGQSCNTFLVLLFERQRRLELLFFHFAMSLSVALVCVFGADMQLVLCVSVLGAEQA